MEKSNWLLTKTIWIFTLILLLSISSCKKEDSTSKELISKAREVIDAAWLAEDADAIVAYLADDIIIMPPNSGEHKGKEANRNFLQGLFDHFNIAKLDLKKSEIIVSGDWASEIGSYEWVLVPEGMDKGIPDQIKFIAIWQRQSDGAWKEVRMIFNSAKPIAGAQ